MAAAAVSGGPTFGWRIRVFRCSGPIGRTFVGAAAAMHVRLRVADAVSDGAAPSLPCPAGR